jgi:hypothetical protein
MTVNNVPFLPGLCCVNHIFPSFTKYKITTISRKMGEATSRITRDINRSIKGFRMLGYKIDKVRLKNRENVGEVEEMRR